MRRSAHPGINRVKNIFKNILRITGKDNFLYKTFLKNFFLVSEQTKFTYQEFSINEIQQINRNEPNGFLFSIIYQFFFFLTICVLFFRWNRKIKILTTTGVNL